MALKYIVSRAPSVSSSQIVGGTKTNQPRLPGADCLLLAIRVPLAGRRGYFFLAIAFLAGAAAFFAGGAAFLAGAAAFFAGAAAFLAGAAFLAVAYFIE